MIDIDFAFYFQIFLRRLPLFLLAVLVVAGAGLAYVFTMPAIYRATAKILVETPQIPVNLARSTVPTGSAEQLQIIEEGVLSRDNLLALADQYRLFETVPRPADDDIVDAMKARILINPDVVQSANGDSPATIYLVSFDAATPELSADVTNRLVTLILDKDVELRTGRAADTVRFFTQEAARLESSIRDVDARILDFKNAHIEALPDSLEFRRNQQSELEQQLLQLGREAETLRNRQADLEAGQLSAGEAPQTPEQKTLADLRQALSQQSLVFSPDSPTIKALQGRIDALAAQVGAAASAGNTDSRAGMNPQVADIRNRLAAIDRQRQEIEAHNAALSASIAETPANETALNELMRNRQGLQAQYDAAVSRLADATTGQQIEMRLKGQRLSLIEAAAPPKVRQGPKRLLLLAFIGAVALGAGLAVVAVPEFLNRRIRRPVEMINKLGIRPLVTIPYVPAPGFRPWRRIGLVAAVLVIGAVLPFLLVAIGGHPQPAALLAGTQQTGAGKNG